MRLFGRDRGQSEAELDRETEEARRRHDEALLRRRTEFDRLRAEVEALPEFAARLQPGEAMFTSVYRPARGPAGFDLPDTYGLTLPAERVLAETGPVGWLSVRPAREGRADMPWDYVRVKSQARPEVYTVGTTMRENDPADVDWLVAELARLDARNRPRDHVLEGRRLTVHFKPYAYWSGRLGSMDRQGVALGLRRVGVQL